MLVVTASLPTFILFFDNNSFRGIVKSIQRMENICTREFMHGIEKGVYTIDRHGFSKIGVYPIKNYSRVSAELRETKASI